MKYVQVIDGAENCTYSIFAATDEDFTFIFPDEQDIEFIRDFVKRVGKKRANEILKRLWTIPIDKKKVHGISGTLFYELDFKKKYYPTKKENEMVTGFETKI
jgi:hypothetical protein